MERGVGARKRMTIATEPNTLPPHGPVRERRFADGGRGLFRRLEADERELRLLQAELDGLADRFNKLYHNVV